MPATENRLESKKVAALFKKRGSVLTTEQIANHFKVKIQKAAASIAILRIKEVVEPASPPKTDTGVSRWVYTG